MKNWALFDFDGTLSLLRAGWQTVMHSLMEETLRSAWRTGHGFPQAEWSSRIDEYIRASTGIQTIEQMQWLHQQMLSMGASAESIWTYKERYRERLGAHISRRIVSVKTGQAPADGYLVRGSVGLLEALREAGYTLCLASGTDDADVRREASLLGIAKYFQEIRGAQDHSWENPKAVVMERMLREAITWQPKSRPLVIGDGPVEIALGRQHRAVTIGVASDETGRRRHDPEKMDRLRLAGADLIVDDWSDLTKIFHVLGR